MKAKFITTSMNKNRETNAKLYMETNQPDELIAIKISMRELKKIILFDLIRTKETMENIKTTYYHF